MADVPKFSFQNTTNVHARGSNAVLKNLNWATRQTLAPIDLERVFQRSTQAVDSPLAAKMSKLPPRVPLRIIQHWKCIFGKNDVEGLPYAEKILCNFRRIPVKDQLFPWAQWRTEHLQSYFQVNCSSLGPVTVANANFSKLQPFRSVLDPTHSQCCFLSYGQIGKIQEVTDQRMLPILWHLNWNNLCLGYTVSKNCSNLPLCWNHMFAWVWYQLKWTSEIAKVMKNPLGFLSTQKRPLAVVSFSEGIVHFSTTKPSPILVPI